MELPTRRNTLDVIPEGSAITLQIDDKNITVWLKESFGHIPPKDSGLILGDLVVSSDELRRSARDSGEYEILSCRECGHGPCVGVEMVKVAHDPDRVRWEVYCSGASDPIRFEFDADRYRAVVDSLSKK